MAKVVKKECPRCERLIDPRGLPTHLRSHGKEGKKAPARKGSIMNHVSVKPDKETVMIAVDRKVLEEILFEKILKS